MKLKRASTFLLVVFVAIVSVVTFVNVEGVYLMTLVKEGGSQFINIISLGATTSNSQPPSKVYINLVPETLTKHAYTKGTLRSERRHLTIFLHYPGDYITDTILMTARWEPHLMRQLEDYIHANPGVQLLDIGCNLGVYTLTAAALGCQVVAVDANPNNTARLVQSLLANGLEGRATVLLNAVSNERSTFEIDLVPENIGGSHVFETSSTSSNSVNAIFIDDLIPLFDERSEVVIKMDIETKEIDALKRASGFFSQRKVSLVLMEWEYIKRLEEIQSVLDFFTARQYRPFHDSTKIRELNISDYLSWPVDVFWMR